MAEAVVTLPSVSVTQVITANAGVDQIVEAASTVLLSAAQSIGFITDWAWTQTSGTAVTINNDDAEIANFVAPLSTTQLTLVFQVSLNSGSDTDSVTITVLKTPVTEKGGVTGPRVLYITV